jgi:hypothetical protein
MIVPAPPFTHLDRLTDDVGIFEHALFSSPRREGGYCTDDAARLLVVTCRQDRPTSSVRRLARVALQFLVDAQGPDGHCRNRRRANGRWQGAAGTGDWWGRAIWGLGTAFGSDERWMRETAQYCFERGVRQRSPWPRSMAFAALGAAEALRHEPHQRGAHAVLADAADIIGAFEPSVTRAWPEVRLSYANAVLPEALVAAGDALQRPDLVRAGLDMLRWLVEHETVDGRLSVTAVDGAGLDELGPRFDQQPIEVATLADACARAALLDDDPRWPRTVAAAAAWFLGENDARQVMWDPATGGGFDGLRIDGVNANQGAESTLALVSTLQHAQRLETVAG